MVRIISLAFTFSILLFSCKNQPEKNQQPNIIFILVDDMGWGDIGVFWQNQRKKTNDRSEPWQMTPSLDALANGGAMLTNHYCPAPVCAPSRASLLLGVTQGHANVRDNQFDKDLQDTYTMGNVLQAAGYHTAAIGKWGLQGRGPDVEAPHWPAHPLERGFDYYLGYIRHIDGHEHYPKEGLYRGSMKVWENRKEISDDLDKTFTTDLWTATAKKYIKERVKDQKETKPFFLYLAYDVPHAVLEYPTQAYPEGKGLNGGLQWLGTPGQMLNTSSGEVDSYVYPEYDSMTWDHDKNPETAEISWPDTYKRYASSCRRIDDGIGDLMALLEDLGIAENTLVVFTSDNGPSRESYLPEKYVPNAPDFFNSFGPFDGIKRDTWEGGVRVPTIANWPAKIAKGQVIESPSAMYDWLPTFASAAGLPIPARIDGKSLLPELTGVGEPEDHLVYVEYYNNRFTPDYDEFYKSHRLRDRNQMQHIRMGDFVGVRYDIQSANDDFEIYNVVSDPQERTNLAKNPDYQGLQQQFKEKVLKIRRPNESAKRPYDSALIAPVNVGALNKGLKWTTHQGDFPWVVDLPDETASETGMAETMEEQVLDGTGMVKMSGFIKVPEAGLYSFIASSDESFHVRIHQAQLFDATYEYKAGTELEELIFLEKGYHPIKMIYHQTRPGATTRSFKGSLINQSGADKQIEFYYR